MQREISVQASNMFQQYHGFNGDLNRTAAAGHSTDRSNLVRNEDLMTYLETKQPMSSIGNVFGESYADNEAYYTQKIAPARA